MAKITVKYESTCTGGAHVTFGVYVNGKRRRGMTFDKADIQDANDINWEEILLKLMREACKSAGATTLAKCRTAVEAKEWTL